MGMRGFRVGVIWVKGIYRSGWVCLAYIGKDPYLRNYKNWCVFLLRAPSLGERGYPSRKPENHVGVKKSSVSSRNPRPVAALVARYSSNFMLWLRGKRGVPSGFHGKVVLPAFDHQGA